MLVKWMFRYFPPNKKIEKLRQEGIVLGTRLSNGRKVYLYMLKDFFVEVIYQNDSIDMEPEKVETFSNLNNLNAYLEKEFSYRLAR